MTEFWWGVLVGVGGLAFVEFLCVLWVIFKTDFSK